MLYGAPWSFGFLLPENMDREDIPAAREKYAEARSNGATGKEAKEIAGFSSKTNQLDLDRNPAIWNLIQQKLRDRGITEEYIAEEYASGIDKSMRPGAKQDRDHNAHATYLKQLGFLMGYTKNAPTVAVQINQGKSDAQELDSRRVERLVEEVSGFIKLVTQEIENRNPSGVPQGNIEDSGGDQLLDGPTPHPGVVPPGGGAPEAPGGSVP